MSYRFSLSCAIAVFIPVAPQVAVFVSVEPTIECSSYRHSTLSTQESGRSRSMVDLSGFVAGGC